MTSVALRVAARYSSVLKTAAFIPDKFFKGYTVELKRLFTQELKGDALDHALRLIRDEVIPLHERFVTELKGLVPHTAHQSLTDRLGLKKDQIQRLSQSLEDSRQAIAFPYPLTTTRAHVLLHINTQVGQQLDKGFGTLGKMFKTQISIDSAKVQEIVDRTLKKMPADVQAAVDADDLDNRNSRLKYEFFQQHVDKAIPRLIGKTKITIDWLSWFERVRDVLAANYSEPLLHTADLYGMKVVINDAVITTKDQEAYIKLLDKSYQLLKKKKLDRAWYGNVFIECKSCGGKPEGGGRIQGHYFIGKDWIQIYDRPTEEVVHVMVHELGHRYWYKSLSPGQRYRFEAYVRAYEKEESADTDRVPHVIESKVLQDARKRIEDVRVDVWAFIGALERAAPDEAPASSWKRRMESRADSILDLYFAAKVVSDLKLPKSCEVSYTRAKNAIEKASQHLQTLPELLGRSGDAFELARNKWCDEARELVDAAASQADGAAHHAFTEYNKIEESKKKERDEKRQKEWDDDEREILPVSNYGKTNIDEAFAEAFTWYVLDREMTQDQKGIFRSVLLRQDRTATRVAERFFQSFV